MGLAGAECQALSVGPELGVLLNKVVFAEPEILADAHDIRFGQADKTGPAATIGTALAKVSDG